MLSADFIHLCKLSGGDCYVYMYAAAWTYILSLMQVNSHPLLD